MAATKYWYGAGAGHVGDPTWDDAGNSYATSNWHDASGNGVAAPANGDTLMFVSGSQNLTGADQSAVTLAALMVQGGYSGTIASATTAWKINVTGALTVMGSAGMYWQGAAGSYMIATANPITPVSLNAGNSSITSFVAISGTITLAGSGDVGLIVGRMSSNSDCKLSIAAGQFAGGLTCYQYGGQVTLAMAPTMWYMFGGSCEQTAGDLPANIMLLEGSTYRYNSSPAGGTLTMTAYGGTFDSSGSSGGFAIANTTVIYGTASVVLGNGSRAITGTLTCYGRVPTIDPGTIITLS